MASCSFLFAKVDNTRTELQDLQQRIDSNYRLNKILKSIPRRFQTLSISILGPQKFNILYNN